MLSLVKIVRFHQRDESLCLSQKSSQRPPNPKPQCNGKSCQSLRSFLDRDPWFIELRNDNVHQLMGHLNRGTAVAEPWPTAQPLRVTHRPIGILKGDPSGAPWVTLTGAQL